MPPHPVHHHSLPHPHSHHHHSPSKSTPSTPSKRSTPSIATPNASHPLSRFPSSLLSTLLLSLPPLTLPSLILTSRIFSNAVNAPFARQYLATHFPFTPVSSSSPRSTLLATLARRRHLSQNSFPEILDLRFPSEEDDKERLYHGFYILSPNSGVLVTVESVMASNEILIRVRWISHPSRHVVTIPAPLELEGGKKPPGSRDGENGGEKQDVCPPEVYFNAGRVVLVYPRRALRNASTALAARSLMAVLDGTIEGGGATRYHGLLEVSVFAGYKEDGRKRRCGPVVNKHYTAFLNTTRTRIYLLRYESSSATPLEVSYHPPTPTAAYDLVPDSSGKQLLLLETHPESEGHIHRVLMISATSGIAERQFVVPLAPLYAAAPRDWSVALSLSEDRLLTFSSPRDPHYRAAMVGQVTILSLRETAASASGDVVKTRYLRAPVGILANAEVGWDWGTNTAYVVSPDSSGGVTVLLYAGLNLNIKAAGTGAQLNRHNMLLPEAMGIIGPPASDLHYPAEITAATLGSSWSEIRTASPMSGGETIYLLSPRLPPPPPPPVTSRERNRSRSRSRPSSYIFSSPGTSRPTSMVSLGGSSVGGWATPRSVLDADGGMRGRMVDPREVERRLRGWVGSVEEEDGDGEEGKKHWWDKIRVEIRRESVDSGRGSGERERGEENKGDKEKERRKGLLGIGWRRKSKRGKED